MKKVLLSLAVFAFAASIAFAQPFVYPDAWTANPGEGVKDSTIRSSTLSGSRTFNPFVTAEQDVVFTRSFYSVPLIFRDYVTRQWIPYAAESFEFNEDGTVAVVQVRQGMKWSDGDDITAADFLFYYVGVTDEDVGTPRREDWLIGEDLVVLEQTGEFELTFTFPKADREAVSVLQTYPAPDHVLGELYRSGGAEALTGAWGTDIDVSTTVWAGPHVPVSYSTDERYVFEANPFFDEWNVDERGNPVNFVGEYNYVVADQDAALNLYVGNELDFYTPSNLDKLGVVAAAVDAGELDAQVLESLYPTSSTTFFVFNWNQASNPFKQELFQNVNFRRAMSHLTPREAMVDLIYQGASCSRL